MKRLLAVLSLLTLVACSTHRIDVQQGNVITQEVVEKLKVGMDKRQVTVVIGTPLIADPFHENRWDYVYSLKRKGQPDIFAHVSLYFHGDTLEKIETHTAPPTEAQVRATVGEQDARRR